jgi:acyl carrier protein
METTKAQVRQFIVDNFYVPSATALGDDESLRDAGVIDSTGVLELLRYLEEGFQVVVQDAEVVEANLDSINKIASFIHRKKADSPIT